MKSESGARKRKVSDDEKPARDLKSKMPIIVGIVAIVSIIGGFIIGSIVFPKKSDEEVKDDKAESESKEVKLESTGSEWGDAYAKYFAERNDLKDESVPTLRAVDFDGNGTPELILDYATSVSYRTQIIYLDAEQKVHASDNYSNARAVILYAVDIPEEEDAEPNLSPEPTWYLYNGSNTETGRYAKIADIIAGRSPSFVSVTNESDLASFHDNYLETSPELTERSLQINNPSSTLKEIVESGDFDPITEAHKKAVAKEIKERADIARKAEEEKKLEEDARKAAEEAAKISAGISVGDYTVAYGTYTGRSSTGKIIKIILQSDDTYTIENDGNISAGSVRVNDGALLLGNDSYSVTANNSFSDSHKTQFSKK